MQPRGCEQLRGKKTESESARGAMRFWPAIAVQKQDAKRQGAVSEEWGEGGDGQVLLVVNKGEHRAGVEGGWGVRQHVEADSARGQNFA
jgi:hypothetical protein